MKERKVLCVEEVTEINGRHMKAKYRYDAENRLEKMSVFQIIDDNKTFYLGCTEYHYPTDKTDPDYELYKNYWIYRVRKDKDGNIEEEAYREYAIGN